MNISRIPHNALISVSNAARGMTGSLLQLQFGLTAISVLNPSEFSKTLETPKFEEILLKEGRPDFRQLGKAMEDALKAKAIVKYYQSHPNKCSFTLDLCDYIKFWNGKDADPKRYYKGIEAASIAVTRACMTGNFQVPEVDQKVASLELIPLVSRVTIKDREKIEIQISPEFMPYLIGLGDLFKWFGYTKVPAQFLANLNTVPEINLAFLVVKKFMVKKETKQSFYLSLEDLRAECGISGKYKEFKDLNRKWLKPAIEGINRCLSEGECAAIRITKKKTGKKVTGIEFHIASEAIRNIKKSKKIEKTVSKEQVTTIKSTHRNPTNDQLINQFTCPSPKKEKGCFYKSVQELTLHLSEKYPQKSPSEIKYMAQEQWALYERQRQRY